ncbi:MAG: hypothetical protein ACI9DH_000393 [Halioglobus sp.]|jgi:hypothetical protein
MEEKKGSKSALISGIIGAFMGLYMHLKNGAK